MSRKKLFTIRGVDIYEDSKILIRSKNSDVLSTGLKQIEKRKFSGVPVTCTAPFYISDLNRPDLGFYDLGFESDSEHYKLGSVLEEELPSHIKSLKDNVLTPYSKKIRTYLNKSTQRTEPLTTTILLNDPNFYDEFSFVVKENDTLVASNIEHRFYIYLLLLKGIICPYNKQDSSEFHKATLSFIDLAVQTKASETKNKSIINASFYLKKALIDKDKEHLLNVLDYLNIKHHLKSSTDEEQIQDFVKTNVIDKENNREAFIHVFENVDKEEVLIYSKITKEIKKASSDFNKVGNVYFYGQLELGSDLKVISKDLANVFKSKDSKGNPKADIVKQLIISED